VYIIYKNLKIIVIIVVISYIISCYCYCPSLSEVLIRKVPSARAETGNFPIRQ
jgi:hypothetical protein